MNPDHPKFSGPLSVQAHNLAKWKTLFQPKRNFRLMLRMGVHEQQSS